MNSSLRSLFCGWSAVALCGALLSGCAETQPDDALVDDDGAAQYKPVSAADAFCPQGFSYDLGNDLCLSASEAAGPFPASMIAFCKRWNPNRADGSNACETTATGAVSTRWTKTIALDARTSTRTASGCAQGTSLDATAAYCSDGTNLFGPFTKDDVSYCKTVAGGGSACETNRVAKGMVRPKTPSTDGLCEVSWEERPGTADYTTINWYERSVGNERPRTFDRTQARTLQGSGRLGTDLCANARVLKTCFDRSVARDRPKNLPYLSWASARGLNPARMKMAFSYQETFLGNLHDNCVNGTCNGVGIGQIITAYPNDNDYSTTLGSSDARWDGISYNVLTNLTYSSRVLSAKVVQAAPSSLVELARAYNGNPDSSIRLPYGTAVQRWYDELGTCGLF
jgi:hypothetical protein